MKWVTSPEKLPRLIVLRRTGSKKFVDGYAEDVEALYRISKRSSDDEARDDRGRWTSSDRADLPEHIRGLKIPPAWKEVTYANDPKADLLVTGRDAKGRLQAIYSERFAQSQAAAKFARVQELARKFDAIRNENKANMRNPATRDHAAALDLIMRTGIRPGSDKDTGAAKQAYGATTLEGRHVVRDGADVRLQFTGKKGVSLDIPVPNEIKKDVLSRAAAAGPGGRLFPNTDDGALRDYVRTLDGGGFKTKDFRTALGTSVAADAVKDTPAPTDAKSYKKAVIGVGKRVAAVLGNTPAIAIRSYVNPAVFAKWKMGAAA